MTTPSNAHDHTVWAMERLDEMDATLAALESNAGKLRGDARANAENELANMRAKRDAFRETLEKDGEAGKASQARTRVALEAGWSAFQASVHATPAQQASASNNSAPAQN
jgi:hypothetical protein